MGEKIVYYLQDPAGRTLSATFEDGELRVTMIFYPEDGLTIEECCETLGWTIIDKEVIEKPKVIPFKRKD